MYLSNHNVWVKVYYYLFTSIFWHLLRNFPSYSFIPQEKKKGNNCTLLAVFMYLGQERRKINYGKEKLLSMVIVCPQILPFLLLACKGEARQLEVANCPAEDASHTWVLAMAKESVGANTHSIQGWQSLVRLGHIIYNKSASLKIIQQHLSVCKHEDWTFSAV